MSDAPDKLVEHLEFCEEEHISVVAGTWEWVVVRRGNPTVPRMTLREVLDFIARESEQADRGTTETKQDHLKKET